MDHMIGELIRSRFIPTGHWKDTITRRKAESLVLSWLKNRQLYWLPIPLSDYIQETLERMGIAHKTTMTGCVKYVGVRLRTCERVEGGGWRV